MATSTKTNKGRFPKGASGNPSGRPVGSRNQSTMLAEQLLADDAGTLTGKVIELAKQGNLVALRLCIERLIPVRKERFLSFEPAPVKSAADLPAAFQSIFAAVAEGRITPGEGQVLAEILRSQAQTIEQVEMERRLQALETLNAPKQ